MTDETPDEQPVADSTETTDESSSASSEQPTEEASEPDTSTSETAADTAEADQSEESESLLVTPDELKAIKADPTLSKLYRSLNKGFTENSQKRAAEVTAAREAMQLVEALKNNPQETLQYLAQAARVNLGGPSMPPDADVQEQMTQLFGADVGAKVADVVQKLVDARTSGLKTTVETTVKEIKTGASLEALRSFRASHPDLSEVIAHRPDGSPITVEQRMTELTQEIEFKGVVDAQTYLNRLYKIAKSDVDAKVQTAKLAQKLATRTDKSASAAKSPGSPAAAKVALEFPRGKGAFAKAAQMALQGQRAG